jgi:uncharacterized membrane protein YcaP (DUF421 family)
VQNALISDDKSVSAGLVTITTLLLLNTVLNKLAYRFPWMEKMIEGTPKILVRNGRILEKVMKSEKISRAVLDEAMREEGVLDVQKVKQATLESDGSISIVKKDA